MVSKLATEDELKSMLEQSWALDEDLTQLMAALPDPVTSRQAIVRGMATTSHSHYRSQRALMELGTTPTVLALVRLHYESVIRSLWYATGATDDWIDRMKLEHSQDNGEPVMGPPVDAMLKRLDEVLPPHVSASLRVLKDASWKPMNSFVHGGLHAIRTGHLRCLHAVPLDLRSEERERAGTYECPIASHRLQSKGHTRADCGPAAEAHELSAIVGQTGF